MAMQKNDHVRAYPYINDDFFTAWWNHLAPKFDIREVQGHMVIHRVSRFKGFISFNEMRIAGWNNAWSQDLNTHRWEEFQQLADQSRWDYFRMIWDEDREGYQCFDELQNAGFTVVNIPLMPAYICDVAGGLESYIQSLSRSGRHEMRRKVRRALPLNPRIMQVKGVDAVRPFMEEFFQYHIPYWQSKDGFSYFVDAREREFAVAWAEALEAEGTLKLERCLINDETANMSMAIQLKDTRFQLLTINTGRYIEYTPGQLRTLLAIQKAQEQGIRYINLGTGIYPYKRVITNNQTNRFEALVANPRSLKGKFYIQWLRDRLAKVNMDESTNTQQG